MFLNNEKETTIISLEYRETQIKVQLKKGFIEINLHNIGAIEYKKNLNFDTNLFPYIKENKLNSSKKIEQLKLV